MGEYRIRFLLHKFSLKSNITVHRGVITPVYTSARMQRPSFGHENQHFCGQVMKKRMPYGRIQNPFLITQIQFKVKYSITVHRCIITPVYNEFSTPVPVCRDPVLAMKISIFVNTSLKRWFSFQTMLRVVFVRASLVLRLDHGTRTSGRRLES